MAGALPVLADCSQVATNEQAASDNRTISQPNPETGEVTASPIGASNVVSSANDVSSGMPVPGTSTPEHVVINVGEKNGH